MRNEDTHFSVNPTNLDIGRSRFPRPFDHKTTFNVGQLIPFYWTEILPGDTVEMKTSKVVRLSTLIDPVMDNLFLDTYYFFVPMRLTWEHTKEFFGENTSGPWAPEITYTVPQLRSGNTGVTLGSVADYMGVPPSVPNLEFNALPIRAYSKVYMDWFIDQMTMTPPNYFIGDTTLSFNDNAATEGGQPYLASKLHDYFTSCTPAPQRGPAVQLPLTGTIPVNFSGTVADVKAGSSIHSMGTALQLGNGNVTDGNRYVQISNIADEDGVRELRVGPSSIQNYEKVYFSNLQVDWPSNVTANLSGASPITVNDLRMAFQMQKWYEKSALYGGRYIEMLKAQFGVTSPDARLQRSEYLGGNRIPLNVTQVENTNGFSGTYSQPLGQLGAYSATSDFNADFTHSFTEHGFLIGICVARYNHSYPQGLERAWSRKTMFDYYFPVFANIGNQPVLKKEIYAQGSSADSTVWGYQEAWADYRYHPDRVSSRFRPNMSNNLGSWHYADKYTSEPFLSATWMQEDKTNVDRTLAVQSNSHPQLIADFFCDATFVRAMPLYSVPGLIDHH